MSLLSTFRFIPAIVMFCLAGLSGAVASSDQLSVEDAYAQAKAGEIVLIDIRSREEWQETGVATVATPISMHEAGFFDKIADLAGGDKQKKIALICATGSRTAYMQLQLRARGFTNILDVPAGMLGRGDLPGWIKAGLPVTRTVP